MQKKRQIVQRIKRTKRVREYICIVRDRERERERERETEREREKCEGWKADKGIQVEEVTKKM